VMSTFFWPHKLLRTMMTRAFFLLFPSTNCPEGENNYPSVYSGAEQRPAEARHKK
jgi:hypothetical protein